MSATATEKTKKPKAEPVEMLSPGKCKTTIYWDAQLYDDIKKLAELDGRSTSNFIERKMIEIRDAAFAKK
jgi:hypothetical protein